MIKANELRINNWILFNPLKEVERYCLVKEIGQKKVTVLDNRLDLVLFEYEFKPIPLTLEILEKAGFEMPANYKAINNDFFLTTDSIGFRLQVEKDHETGYYTCEFLLLGHIKHLHQLQNLYFSLTNEELNVQL